MTQEAYPSRKRKWLLRFGIAALCVGGLVLLGLRRGGPSMFTLSGIGIGPGGIVKNTGGQFGPIAIELDPALENDGVKAHYLRTAGKGESGLFYRVDECTIGLKITCDQKPLAEERLAFTGYDENGTPVVTGPLDLPALDAGASAEVEIDYVLKGDQPSPTRIRIHR